MNGMGFLYSEVAQKHGVPVRVVHSHNSAFGSGQAVVKAVMHSFGRAAFGGSALFASPAPPTQGITSSVPAPSRS